MIPSRKSLGNNPPPAGASVPSVSLLSQYPPSERFRLSTGKVVTLPVHQADFDFLVLSGDADPAAVDLILQPEDLVAARHDVAGSPRAEIQLYVIDYRDGDAGAYREMFEVFTVHDRTDKGFQPKSGPQYFVQRVRVDEDRPLTFGIDVWGYPKQLGTTVYDSATDPTRVSFRYTEPGDPKAAFSGSLARQGFQEYPRNPPFEFVTPYAIRRSYASVINAPRTGDGGRCQFKAYSATDRFDVDATTSLGSELQRLTFVPKTWFLCEKMEAVGFLADIGPAAAQPAATHPAPTPPAVSVVAARTNPPSAPLRRTEKATTGKPTKKRKKK